MLEKFVASSLSLSPSLTFAQPRFFKMLESDALRAWYGEAHVLKAVERGAVGKLLISDEIFRCVPWFSWCLRAETLMRCDQVTERREKEEVCQARRGRQGVRWGGAHLFEHA